MQDITTPNTRRGAVRSLERPVTSVSRPVPQRIPGAKPVSMDGMIRPGAAHKSLIMQPKGGVAPVVAPKPEPMGVQAPQPVQPVNPSVPAALNRPAVPIAQVSNNEGTGIVQKNEFIKEPVVLAETKVENSPPEQPIFKKKRFDIKKFGLILLALIILGVTAYISVDTWLTNKQAKAVISGTGEQVAISHTKEAEGKDETELTPESLQNYAVAADLPRALYIDKLNIASRILPMSVNSDGSVQAPLNIFDAGWYTGSVKPGEIGATFIDGHASGAVKAGLFAYLDTLAVGDTLQVEKGDGAKLTYKVVHTETVPLEGLDMKKVLLPYGNTLKGLNLMTCTGEWVDDKDTYDQRVLVYTELVE